MSSFPNSQSSFSDEYNRRSLTPASKTLLRRLPDMGGKIIFVGALLSILGFLLPLVTITIFFTTATASGFTLARDTAPALWAYPLTMVAAMMLTFVVVPQIGPRQVLAPLCCVVVGAGWTVPLLGAATMVTINVGGYCAILGAMLVLAGGVVQVYDAV